MLTVQLADKSHNCVCALAGAQVLVALGKVVLEARIYQFSGVILLPVFLVVSQVARKGLVAPGHLGWVADGRKGADGFVELRVAEA